MGATRIVVIGGGIAGLTTAFRLRQRAPEAEVTLLEAGPRAGGHARTVREDGFIVEAGPNGFLCRADEPEPLALVQELGLEPSRIEALPASKRRFVVHGGRLRRVPDSPPALLTSDALSLPGRLRVLMEPLARRAPEGCEETVYQFARRRVGREAADVLVDTAISGISAGDSRALSMAAAFPRMIEMEREHGSLIRAMIARRQPPPRLVSFRAGMSELTDTLAARLGGALRTGARVRALARTAGGWRIDLERESLVADRVVLATGAREAAGMVAALDPELARVLESFPFAGLAVVAMAFDAATLGRTLEGYGYLVGRGEGLDTLGVVWESSLFEGRAPQGRVLVRAMMGGARRPEVATLSETELVVRARRELARVMGVGATPVGTWAWRWPGAIAQYTHGQRERVARARSLAGRHPGLELAGTSYDGIAFGAAIISAERAAERMLAAGADPRPATPTRPEPEPTGVA